MPVPHFYTRIDDARTFPKIDGGEHVYVGYIRVSRHTQAGDHISLSEQEARLRSFVEQVGGRLICVEQDLCTGEQSAAKRPGLAAAMDQCVAHDASLLVPAVDRLARSSDVTEFLDLHGIEVTTVLEGAVSRERRLVPLLQRAQTYSEGISTNARAAHARKRAAGKKLGNIGNLEAHRSRGTANNKARSEAKIEELVDMLVAHPELLAMSLADKAAWLNAAGVLNRLSLHAVPVPWTANSLRKPLSAARKRI